MQITGVLKIVKDIHQVSDKFQKREFVVVTNEQYSQTIQIELQGNNVDIIDAYKVGDEVTCDLNLRGKCWTNPEGKEVYFNTIVAWKIQKSGGYGNASDYAPPTNSPSTQTNPREFPQSNQPNSFADDGVDDSGLPF